MEKCRKCGKRFLSKLEEKALQKATNNTDDPAELEKLKKKISKKVCMCPDSNRATLPPQSQPPPDLQWHDKFDRWAAPRPRVRLT